MKVGKNWCLQIRIKLTLRSAVTFPAQGLCEPVCEIPSLESNPGICHEKKKKVGVCSDICVHIYIIYIKRESLQNDVKI
jgi:hypothetical protein